MAAPATPRLAPSAKDERRPKRPLRKAAGKVAIAAPASINATGAAARAGASMAPAIGRAAKARACARTEKLNPAAISANGAGRKLGAKSSGRSKSQEQLSKPARPRPRISVMAQDHRRTGRAERRRRGRHTGRCAAPTRKRQAPTGPVAKPTGRETKGPSWHSLIEFRPARRLGGRRS